MSVESKKLPNVISVSPIRIHTFVLGETLDNVGKNIGFSLSSFRTLSGTGGIFAGIAAQNPARKIANGLLLAHQDRFEPGDHIKLDDGTTGVIENVGLMNTVIIGKCSRYCSSQTSFRST